MKRNEGRMGLYKEAINICCHPECQTRYQQLHTHHVRPIGKGGICEFSNYIVLCSYCHRGKKLHSQWDEHQIELLTWKFQMEILLIKHSSDDYSAKEYGKLLRKHINSFDGLPINLDEVLSFSNDKLITCDEDGMIKCEVCGIEMIKYPRHYCNDCREIKIAAGRLKYYKKYNLKMPNTHCELCGQRFILRSNSRKYCKECRPKAEQKHRDDYRRQYNLPSIDNHCKICGKEFIRTSSTQKYCSEKCRGEYVKKYRKNYRKKHGFIDPSSRLKKCEICEKEFVGRSIVQKYCVECRPKAEKMYKERYREKQSDSLSITTCLICDKEFMKRSHNHKYCSEGCRLKVVEEYRKKHNINMPLKNKNCKICGKKFESRKSHQKYCVECKPKAREQYRAKYYQKYGIKTQTNNNCEICGKEFKKKSYNHKYCLECRPEAVREYNRRYRERNFLPILSSNVKSCEFCGEEFKKRSHNQKYCSKCRSEVTRRYNKKKK